MFWDEYIILGGKRFIYKIIKNKFPFNMIIRPRLLLTVIFSDAKFIRKTLRPQRKKLHLN